MTQDQQRPSSNTGGGRADKWLGLVRIGSTAALRVGLAIAIARLGGRDLFAVFVLAQSVEIIVNTLLQSGLVTPLTTIAPGLPSEQRTAFFRFGLSLCRRGAVLATLLVAAIGTPIALSNGVDPLTWLAASAAIGAWVWSTAASSALAAAFRSGAGLIGSTAALLATAAALGVAYVAGGPLLTAMWGTAAVAHTLTGTWMARQVVRRRDADASPNEELPTELRQRYWQTAKVVAIGSVANGVCARLHPFVLAGFGGAPALALFGSVQSLVGPVRTVGGALGEVLRPRLALNFGGHGDPQRGKRALAQVLLLVAGSGAVGLALAWTLGEEAGRLVFGDEFRGLGVVLPAGVVAVTLATLGHQLAVAMQTLSVEGAGAATRWRTGAAVLTLAATWPACALDGARGAFLAMTAAEVVFLFGALRFLTPRLAQVDAEAAAGAA